MANRVVMGELPGGGVGLRVSRPGHDALNASLQGKYVALDTRWIGASRVLTMGTVNLSSSGTSTVMFGVSLPIAPAVIAMFEFDGNWWSFDNYAGGREFTGSADANDVNDALRPDDNPAVDVRTDRVIFRNPNSFAISVSYIVLRL